MKIILGRQGKSFRKIQVIFKTKAEKISIASFLKSKIAPAKHIVEAMRKYNSYGDDYIKAYFNFETGGFNVYHKSHKFDKIRGWTEKETGKLLADQGYQVEFLDESIVGKSPDIKINDETWDIKAVFTNNSKSINNSIEKAAKKADNVILYYTIDFNQDLLDIAIKRYVKILNNTNKRRIDMGLKPFKRIKVYPFNKEGKLINVLK